MNYITRMQSEAAAKDAEIAALRSGLAGFLTHIQGPKFQGNDAQWISTEDVARFIRYIESSATDAAMGVS